MTELTAPRTVVRPARTEQKRPLLERIARYQQAYLLLVPTFVLLFIFNYYPALSALYRGFFVWNGANVKEFTGINNYMLMLNDTILWNSFGNMFILTLALVAINLTLPLLAAAFIFHLRNLRL